MLLSTMMHALERTSRSGAVRKQWQVGDAGPFKEVDRRLVHLHKGGPAIRIPSNHMLAVSAYQDRSECKAMKFSTRWTIADTRQRM